MSCTATQTGGCLEIPFSVGLLVSLFTSLALLFSFHLRLCNAGFQVRAEVRVEHCIGTSATNDAAASDALSVSVLIIEHRVLLLK